MRSRWVTKEYNTEPRHDLFNATSPLEGVKHVISEAASSNQKGTVLLVIDVQRAYFYAKARRRVYIELPEGGGGGPGSQCGLLRKSLYGTNASLEVSWTRSAYARDKRARVCTPTSCGESAFRSMVMASLSR